MQVTKTIAKSYAALDWKHSNAFLVFGETKTYKGFLLLPK
jgi:hypothetical protein